MDLVSLFYAGIIALGLMTADTILNAETIYLDATVAELVAVEGYEPEVVDGIFINDVQKISETRSLIAAPTIGSSNDKPFSVALAELVNMKDALTAVQSMIGYVPPRMLASVIAQDERQEIEVLQRAPDGEYSRYLVKEKATIKFVLTGYSKTKGYFEVIVEKEADKDGVFFNDLVKGAAYQSMLQLEPYFGVLYKFEENFGTSADFAVGKKLIDDEIAKLRPTPIHKERAKLENLRGIVALLENDLENAADYFARAVRSDPAFSVGYLNLAFLKVHLNDYESAIEETNHVIKPWYWPQTGNSVLLATGHIIRGVAYTGLKNYANAEAEFRDATRLNPETLEGYVYWARLLELMGRDDEAAKTRSIAKQNLAYSEHYPEAAILYFWLTDEDNQPLKPRGDFKASF